MVLSRNGKIVKTVIGQVRGMIAFDKKGDLGFGYDPIFFFKPLRKTFGELRPKEKNAVSHRGRALKKMKAFLADYLDVSPSFLAIIKIAKKGCPPSQGRGTA
jgi:XTP/dITP diphosphohydrolase